MANSLSVFVFGENNDLIETTIDSLQSFFMKENIKTVSTPKHADVLAVIEPVSNKSASVLRLAYDSMLSPKWVISITPDESKNRYSSYAVIHNLHDVIPVNTECFIDSKNGKENLVKAFNCLKTIIRNER